MTTYEEVRKFGYDKAFDDVMNMLNDIEFGGGHKRNACLCKCNT